MDVIGWNEPVDGPLSEAAMRRKLEGMGYLVARYVYAPGTVFPAHSHEVDKMDGVLSGRFRMQMQGASLLLEAGDMLAVPRGVVHSAEVVGEQSVVSLDAIKI